MPATARNSRWYAPIAPACLPPSPTRWPKRKCGCMMRALPRSANVSRISSSLPIEATRLFHPRNGTPCGPACCATSVPKTPGPPYMQIQTLESLIDDAFERRADLTQNEIEGNLRDAVDQVLNLLESGERRVAEPDGKGGWTVNAWLKKAVLLYFRMNGNRVMDGGPSSAFDKVPLRFTDGDALEYANLGARVVPGALVRRGAHIAKDAVLMPSYTNIGAYVGAGTMVDTWATVGSCAQIGSNVHLSGGVGIGGVLEPPEAAPVMIGDECLIGSRCIVANGARVGEGTVLGAGCVLTQSIPVIDAETGEELGRGVVP